ncbi:sensor histidine kinase [Hallella multisaccharivorax]|uniref:sensor histidine kinase n=1 Tax=Hallella multisaccharivorax TaxID=310514 RepID=UPI00360C6706
MITEMVLTIALSGSLGLNVWLWRKRRKDEKKTRFLLEAIDNGDYNFRFPQESKNKNDRQMNTYLNKIRDILSHAREEQIEKERFYEYILDSVDTGILLIDEEHGYVRQCNQAARKMLKRTSITYVKQIEDNLRRFSTRHSYTILKGKRMLIIGFNDIHGELVNQEIDAWIKLIRVLTHEIMNTITPIISLSTTLLPQSKGEMKEGLTVINKTSRELISFVENYRKFTHVPQPQPKIFYLKAFLNRQIQLCATMLSTETDADEIIRLNVRPEKLMVYADETLIARVISNLLKNALEATYNKQRKEIVINAFSDENENVIIDITDNGEKIDPEIAAHVFVPFFTTKRTGNGIGLPLSRQIMRANNGMLELADNDSGKVTFRLTFM